MALVGSWTQQSYASVSSATFTLTGSRSAGNSVFVTINWQAPNNNVASPTSVTLGGTSMTLAAEAKFNDGFANTNCAAVYYLHNAASGTNTNVVVTFSSAGSYATVDAEEHSGLANAAPSLTTSQTADVDPVACTSGTLPTASELLFFLGTNAKGTSQSWPTPTGGGYTWVFGVNVLDWNNATSGFAAHTYATATTSVTATAGTAGGVHNGVSKIVAFSLAAANGSVSTTLTRRNRPISGTASPAGAASVSVTLTRRNRPISGTASGNSTVSASLTRRNRPVSGTVAAAGSVALSTTLTRRNRPISGSVSTQLLNIVFTGNSYVAGSRDTPAGQSSNRLAVMTAAAYPTATVSEYIGGTSDNIYANYSGSILPLKDSGRRNILVFFEIHNNVEGTTNPASDVSNLNSNVTAWKADGWEVIVLGTIACAEYPLDYWLQECNTLLFASSTANLTIDLRNQIPSLNGTPAPGASNPDFSGGLVHLSDSGYLKLSNVFLDNFATYLAGKKPARSALIRGAHLRQTKVTASLVGISAVSASLTRRNRPISGAAVASGSVAVSTALSRRGRPISGSASSGAAPLSVSLARLLRPISGTVAPSGAVALSAALGRLSRPITANLAPSGAASLSVALSRTIRPISGSVVAAGAPLSVSLTRSQRPIAGTAVASGSASASVSLSRYQRPAVASVAPSGSAGLTVSLTRRQRQISGSVQAASAQVSAALARLSRPISGSAAPSGAAPLALTLTRVLRPISGAMAPAGNASLSLSLARHSRPISGSVSASAATLSASLFRHQRPIAGTAVSSGAAPLFASLARYWRPIVGQVTGSGSAVFSVSLARYNRPLTGSVTAGAMAIPRKPGKGVARMYGIKGRAL